MPALMDVTISEETVAKAATHIQGAAGPDGLSGFMLKNAAGDAADLSTDANEPS